MCQTVGSPVRGTGQGTSVYWTDSRRGLIVVGDRSEVTEIARSVGLSCDAVVAISAVEWAVALWGDAVAAYAERYESPERAYGREADQLVSELVSY